MDKVTPSEVAEGLSEFWSQRVIARANGNLFKVAKGIGSTTWHTHDDQDETFLLLRGQLTIQLRTGDVHLEPGDLYVIPRGVEHCPLAAEEAHFLLVGPDVTSTAAGGKPDWSYAQGTQGWKTLAGRRRPVTRCWVREQIDLLDERLGGRLHRRP